jgi:pimeloyl-ACP methyl ester carboxylesterase
MVVESAMVGLQAYLGYEVNVYTMDHRGTGRSTLLDCVAAQATMTGSPDGTSVGLDEVPECAAALEGKYGSDLSSFSVTSAATDISTFISSFTPGQSTFVYGVSYGTALVERLIHLATPEVDGYILDGIATSSGTDLDKFENFSRWDSDFGEVGDRFLVQCANDTTCNSKFPTTSLQDTLTALIESFDSDPSSTCATLVSDITQTEPASYGLRNTLGSLFMDATTRTLIPVIAYRLNRCSSTDVPVLTYLLNALNSESEASEDDAFESTLLYNLIVYSEMWESPEPSEAVMLERYTNYSVTSGGTYGSVAQYCAFSKEDSDVCNELSVGNYNANSITYARDQYWNVAATIPSQASVLLLSSKLDPQTPQKYAEYLHEALNGTAKKLVTFEHATHGTIWTTPISDESSMTCGMELLGSYVSVGGDLTQLDESCVSAMPAINFTVPTYMLYGYMSTADAYEGSYDASLSSSSSTSSSSTSTSDGDGSSTSYKAVFIVFVALFAVALIGCAAFAYRWYKLKRRQTDGSAEITTPKLEADS